MSAFRPFSTSRLVLLGIEPYRVHAYWDAEPGAVDEARLRVGDPEARLVLRFHEVSRVELDGASSGETFDIAAGALTGNHYVSLLSPGKTLVAELGLAAAGGPFASLVRSNVVDLPRGSESPEYVERSRRVGGRPDPLWRPRRPETVEDAAPARAADAALSEEEEPGGRGAEAWTEAPLPVLVGAGARAAGEGPAPAPGIREPSLGPGREA
ncbi:MAG: DUF4912 domain-containing protein, partial [Planctomycetes bacterium]|nr:DUF4912 domain-containing protein [Planctomycetota bacterium]